MTFLIKEKFRLEDLVAKEDKRRRVVFLLEPEKVLSEIYCQHLEKKDFEAYVSHNAEDFQAIYFAEPDVIVVNLDFFGGRVLEIDRFFSETAKNFPAASLVTLSEKNLSDAKLDQVMTYGVRAHLDKKFSRPEDLVILIENLIK